MMTDTAQSPGTAETDPVSTADAIAAAAQAFRTYDPDAERAPERLRDPDTGRFVSPDADAAGGEEGPGPESGEQIEATDPEAGPGDGTEAEAGAESQEEGGEAEEAADEAQPSEAAMPASWPAEHAGTWKSLPPEARAIIAEREGQRDAAVNAKFQEAANLRKAHEAEINEAQRNRQAYAEAAELVLSLVQPQMPPASMLDVNSNDYDPDRYHLMERQFRETSAFLQQHRTQLASLRAQEEMRQFEALNAATRDAFIQEVPDVADQLKAPAIFDDLIRYAVGKGIPQEMFDAPTSAVEWNLLWKAREYDRIKAAEAKVRREPKPEPRKPQPAVRPGVATPKSAIEHQKRTKAMERLKAEGSVDAGAAALKHLLKGNLS